MKRKLVNVFILFFSINVVCNSQDTARITFGIRAGINLQNIRGKDTNANRLESEQIVGYTIGVVTEIPVMQGFYLQPGLSFTTKGYKDKELTEKPTINIYYLELPVNLIYKRSACKGYLIAGLGPFIGYGVYGKVKTGDSDADIEFQKEVEITDPNYKFYLKALDAGVNILVGYEFNDHLIFQLNAQLGLLNIYPVYKGALDDQTSRTNWGYGLSISYRF